MEEDKYCKECFIQTKVCICSLKSCSPIDPLSKGIELLIQSDHPHIESLIISDVIATILESLAKAARARANVVRFKEKGIETCKIN